MTFQQKLNLALIFAMGICECGLGTTTGDSVAKYLQQDTSDAPVVSKEDFPEIVQVSTHTGTGTVGKCTGTVVGPQVVILASHCGENGQIATFTFRGESYQANFVQSPYFNRSDASNDVAVVTTDRPLRGAEPAMINGKPAEKSKTLVAGYGCYIGPNGQLAWDGNLRVGAVHDNHSETTSKEKITGQGQDVKLCSGDSGGPQAVPTADGKNITVVGINSKGNHDINIHSDLSLPSAQNFLADISKRFEICGLSQQASACKPGTADAAEESPSEKPSAETHSGTSSREIASRSESSLEAASAYESTN